MLKEAIEKIVSLAGPTTRIIDNKLYSDKELVLVDEEKSFPRTLKLSSLDSVCTMVRQEKDKTDEKIFVRVISPTEVDVITGLDYDMDRSTLYSCVADTPRIRVIGCYVDHDTACIELRSLFVPGGDCGYLLDLLSRMTIGSKVSTADNGITQTVEAQKGVALKEKVDLKPRVNLTPFRTFIEVDQPASEFLLRVNQDSNICLYEADGGVWKLEAVRNVALYMEKQLSDLIDDGKVVVIR